MKSAVFLLLFAVTTQTTWSSEELIELKDGTRLSKKNALNVYKKLEKMYQEQFTAFYDLRYRCENHLHSFMWKESEIKLRIKGLISAQSQPNHIVKAIMRNGTEGKHLLVKLVWPFKENPN